MKDRIFGALTFALPVLIFAAIIHDGLTLQAAQHSGTQQIHVSQK
jgi:hypothetical protein